MSEIVGKVWFVGLDGMESYLAVLGQINLERLGVVLEAERAHREEDVLAVDGFPLFLMALLRRCDRSASRWVAAQTGTWGPKHHRSQGNDVPSLVMNEMNSLTHSCMHSFASLAILAFSGSAVFMMRATGAKLRMLAS